MMASRKAVLDKNKQQLLDSVNASNKVYSNEELSILVSEQQELIKTLQNSINQNQKTTQEQFAQLEKDKFKYQKTFKITKYVTRGNVGNTKIKLYNTPSVIAVDMKMLGDYAHINFGGLVHYTMGTIRGTNANTCYGTGSTMTKSGSLADFISSIEVDCSVTNTTYLKINMSCPTSDDNYGSPVIAFVTLYSDKEITDATTVEFM